MCRAEVTKVTGAFIIASRQTFELGPVCHLAGLKCPLACLVKTSSSADSVPSPRDTLPGHPLRHDAMATSRQQRSNINTLTLFGCLKLHRTWNAGRSGRGGQCNPKLGGGRAAGGEIGGKCISGYRQHAIRSIVGKARLDTPYPCEKVSSSLVVGHEGSSVV